MPKQWVNGVELYYEVTGKEDGKVVLFLHVRQLSLIIRYGPCDLLSTYCMLEVKGVECQDVSLIVVVAAARE